MHVFKMAAVVGVSNPTCMAAAAAAWSLECVAEMRNSGHVGANYALTVALVFGAFK
jgi:hypothetical protein